MALSVLKPGKLEISNLSRATPESPQVYHLSRRLQLVYFDDSTSKFRALAIFPPVRFKRRFFK